MVHCVVMPSLPDIAEEHSVCKIRLKSSKISF